MQIYILRTEKNYSKTTLLICFCTLKYYPYDMSTMYSINSHEKIFKIYVKRLYIQIKNNFFVYDLHIRQ